MDRRERKKRERRSGADSKDSILATPNERDQAGVEKPVPPENLWEQLEALEVNSRVYKNDLGFTAYDYMKRYGNLPRQTAHSRLERLVANGKLRAGWRTEIRNGVRRQLRVYLPVPQKKNEKE